ncbi:MAG: hypothetical protein LBF75_01125 [Treponema sp.]|jgi:predicted Fe-Mo cluster-binding NifX family protein|nr:hypothetical protein [Treponema sp.]
MPYKIALTSSDGIAIDKHFGETETFLIFDVDDTGSGKFNELRALLPESPIIISGRESPTVRSGCAEAAGGGCGGGSSVHGCGHRDVRMKQVAGLLSDCRYILTARIGKKPYMFLQREGITALESPADIPYAISKLHAYHVRFGRINREKERST